MSKRTKHQALKNSTALSKATRKPIKAVGFKIEATKSDPLSAVADLPGILATEASHKIPAAQSNAAMPSNASGHAPEAPAIGLTSPWVYQTKLFKIAETNTKFLSQYVGRFAGAKSPQDLVTISSEFSKEGGLLFKEQSNAIFKMFAI